MTGAWYLFGGEGVLAKGSGSTLLAGAFNAAFFFFSTNVSNVSSCSLRGFADSSLFTACSTACSPASVWSSTDEFSFVARVLGAKSFQTGT